MVQVCVVVGCHNRSNRGERRSFHNIPKIITAHGEQTEALTTRRRAAWISAVGREDWVPSVHSRVCSDHFISGTPSALYDDSNSDWAPTLKMGHQSTKGSFKSLNRMSRKRSSVVQRKQNVRGKKRSDKVIYDADSEQHGGMITYYEDSEQDGGMLTSNEHSDMATFEADSEHNSCMFTYDEHSGMTTFDTDSEQHSGMNTYDEHREQHSGMNTHDEHREQHSDMVTYDADSLQDSGMVTYDADSVQDSGMVTYDADILQHSGLTTCYADSVQHSGMATCYADSVQHSGMATCYADSVQHSGLTTCYADSVQHSGMTTDDEHSVHSSDKCVQTNDTQNIQPIGIFRNVVNSLPPGNKAIACNGTHNAQHIDDHSYSLLRGQEESDNDLQVDSTTPDEFSNSCRSYLTDKSVPVFTLEVETMSLSVLYKDIIEKNFLGPNFFISIISETVRIHELYNSCPQRTSVKLSVVIDAEFHISIFVHRKSVPKTHPIWDGLPKVFSSAESVRLVIDRLNTLTVCLGNPDRDFQTMTQIGCDIKCGVSGEVIAYRETDFCATNENGSFRYHSNIRSVNCMWLVQGIRCKPCQNLRKVILLRRNRVIEKNSRDVEGKNYVHATTRHSVMSREELVTKMSQQKKEIDILTSEVERMKRDCLKYVKPIKFHTREIEGKMYILNNDMDI